MPDFLLTERQRAEREFDDDAKTVALEALQVRLTELTEAEEAFKGCEGFMDTKKAELDHVHLGMLFARGDDLVRLQGRGLALYEFLNTPRMVREERRRVENQISEIVTVGPDAGE